MLGPGVRRRMRRLALALLAAFLLAPRAAPEPDAPVHLAPFAELPPVPEGTVSFGAEPSILVLPSGRVLVGDTAGIHGSDNGGATWWHAVPLKLPGTFSDGLPLARDAAGTIYTAGTQGQVINVASSKDDGRTWQSASLVMEAWAGVADRPWVAAGAPGEVAVVYYATGAGERCAYSTDGGVTFLTRSLANNGPSNAGSLALDADGRVWYAQNDHVVRWPTPCGGTPQTISVPMAGRQIFGPMALSPDGDVFVPRPTAGNAQLELTGFHGMERTSVKKIVVSPADVRSSTFSTAAARGDGEVVVAWYGSATAGNPALAFPGSWDVYVARVKGFWTDAPTVTVTKVTTTPNHVGGFCMGGISCTPGVADRDLLDYFGVALDEAGNAHLAYGHDGATSRAEVRYAVVPAS